MSNFLKKKKAIAFSILEGIEKESWEILDPIYPKQVFPAKHIRPPKIEAANMQ
jgi:hypothetical protein